MRDKYLQQHDRRSGEEDEAEYAVSQTETYGRLAVDELLEQLPPRPHDQRKRKTRAVPQPEQPKEDQPAPEQENHTPRTSAHGPRERPAVSPREQEQPVETRQGAGTPQSSAAQRIKTATGIKQRNTPQFKEAGTGAPIIKERDASFIHPSIESIQPAGGTVERRFSQQPPQTPACTDLHRRGRSVAPADDFPRPARTVKRHILNEHRSGDFSRRFGASASRLSIPVDRAAAGPRPKVRGEIYPKRGPGPKAFRFPIGRAAQAPSRTVQQRIKRQAVQQAAKAAKTSAVFLKKAAQATAKAAASLVNSLVALIGGGVLLIALVAVMIIAAIASSPFGLFFAGEHSAPGAVSVAEAVAQVNTACNAKLEELQSGGYDSIDATGCAPDWTDVLAVFATRYAGAEDGVDVANLDADRVDKLTATFWDMCAIAADEEEIDHPDSDPDDDTDDSWTERVLHITITARTAEDMKTDYGFTTRQISALDELLADRAALASLARSLAIANAAAAVLKALPDDLSPERRAVVETALALYGKVNYFWGGKSLVQGWDSRWGQLMQVWAEGSPTTGTYRPYGLDCSGFLDWVFYNASGGSYIIGHGGGAHMQHTYCTPISWDEAAPGDLVFYPEDEHAGIVCGRDGDGDLQIIHCASGYNNVVITGKAGFTSVARPLYYGE